jgi:hypothetical protein
MVEVLDAWIDGLEAAHVLMGPREAVSAELSRWIALIGPAIEGDQAAAHELYKLVAFHARALGADGRPASAALMQISVLEDLMRSSAPASAPVLREILRITVDSHALGSSERAKNRHHLEIRDFSPVVRLGEKTIVGFLLGAMESDLIDAMIGRLLREAARSGADNVVLDCFGAARDNSTFHRTVQAFLRHEVGCRVTLILAGLRDPEATKAALAALGCNMERLRFESDINAAIATQLDKKS